MEGLINLILDDPKFFLDAEDKWSILREKDTDEITHIYFTTSDKLLTMCIIAPHSGTNFQYMLRSCATANFDRWSVVPSQYKFNSPDTLATFLLNGMTVLYKDALEDLGDDYKSLEEENEIYEDRYYELKHKYEDKDDEDEENYI